MSATAELPATRAGWRDRLRPLRKAALAAAHQAAINAVLKARVAKLHRTIPGISGACCFVISAGLWFGWAAAFATAGAFLCRLDSRMG